MEREVLTPTIHLPKKLACGILLREGNLAGLSYLGVVCSVAEPVSSWVCACAYKHVQGVSVSTQGIATRRPLGVVEHMFWACLAEQSPSRAASSFHPFLAYHFSGA